MCADADIQQSDLRAYCFRTRASKRLAVASARAQSESKGSRPSLRKGCALLAEGARSPTCLWCFSVVDHNGRGEEGGRVLERDGKERCVSRETAMHTQRKKVNMQFNERGACGRNK